MFNKAVYENEKDYAHFYSENKKNNSPESIRYLCIKLAQLKEIKFEELAKNVYNNSSEILKEFI